MLLATPIVMGIAGNSPTLFGHRLWHETRVPLFKHSIDSRIIDSQWRQPARVSFGHGFLRRSVYELFAESVALHPPILPISSEVDYRQLGQLVADAGVKPIDEILSNYLNVWSFD